MSYLWNNVAKEDVLTAIKLFDSKHISYPEPRNTFLIFNNKKYPAKHIRGMAYYVANKIEISKNDYNGGQETADFFTKRGFKVEYHKGTLKPKTVQQTISKINLVEKQVKPVSVQRLNAVSQKNALQRLLQKHYGHIETEKKFTWLRTPNHDILPDEYKQIVTALSNYRNHIGFQKSYYQVSCDIVLDEHKLIIEYDENQHFSQARKITLENYPANIKINYSKEQWIASCVKINARDNDPVDRDERRAYFDAVRDIEAFKHGYTLIRIKHGEVDWEAVGAEHYLSQLLPNKNTANTASTTRFGKHKIARLIVTGNEHDIDGKLNVKMVRMLLLKFIAKVYKTQQFEFIVTAGGFLTFKFPVDLQYKINIQNAGEKQISLLQSEANKTINNFFQNLPDGTFTKLKEIADYFTIGIDGFNETNGQKIELVAVYDLKKEMIIRWTGKFYPTEQEKGDLIRINDLKTHFIHLNDQNVVILGCHDLNIYSPRGQAAASPDGWKKLISERFRKLSIEFIPDIILQHPHTTDTPNIWNAAWRKVEEELPNVKHFASGINFYNKNGVRGDLNKILEKTKKGDVVDFHFV